MSRQVGSFTVATLVLASATVVSLVKLQSAEAQGGGQYVDANGYPAPAELACGHVVEQGRGGGMDGTGAPVQLAQADLPVPMHHAMEGHVSGDQHAAHAMGADATGHSAAEHAMHQQMMHQQGYERSRADYAIPDVTLIDQDGEPVSLREVLSAPEPVMLNFIFTTCTTVCPVLSASFSQAQRLMEQDMEDVRMVSISIDPEHDVPAVLRAYGEKFHAGERWQFLTGNHDDIVAVLKAFNTYQGDKMNHRPITLMRMAGQGAWLRLDGFANGAELIAEYRALEAGGAVNEPAQVGQMGGH